MGISHRSLPLRAPNPSKTHWVMSSEASLRLNTSGIRHPKLPHQLLSIGGFYPSFLNGQVLVPRYAFFQVTTPIRGGNSAEHLCNRQLKRMICQENPQRGQVLGMFHDGAVAKNGAWQPVRTLCHRGTTLVSWYYPLRSLQYRSLDDIST